MTAEAVTFLDPGGEISPPEPQGTLEPAGKLEPLVWDDQSQDLCWEACPRAGFRAVLRTRRGDWETFMCAEHAARLESIARRRGGHRPGLPGEPWVRISS